MLFWAEGSKNKNRVEFANSSPDMHKLFIKFLRESYGIDDSRIGVRCLFYKGNDATKKEVEEFWLNVLNLPRTCLKKAMVFDKPAESNYKKNKLVYGVCTIRVYSTELVQNIFGAVQQYGNFDCPEWLD
jgi:hypothetical protein